MVDRINFSPPVLFIKSPLPPSHKAQMRIEYYGKDSNFQITGTTCEDPSIQAAARPTAAFAAVGARRAAADQGLSAADWSFSTGTKIPPQGLRSCERRMIRSIRSCSSPLPPTSACSRNWLRRAQVTSQRRTP